MSNLVESIDIAVESIDIATEGYNKTRIKSITNDNAYIKFVNTVEDLTEDYDDFCENGKYYRNLDKITAQLKKYDDIDKIFEDIREKIIALPDDGTFLRNLAGWFATWWIVVQDVEVEDLGSSRSIGVVNGEIATRTTTNTRTNVTKFEDRESRSTNSLVKSKLIQSINRLYAHANNQAEYLEERIKTLRTDSTPRARRSSGSNTIINNIINNA